MDVILHAWEQFGQGLIGVVGGDLESMAVNAGVLEQIGDVNLSLERYWFLFQGRLIL